MITILPIMHKAYLLTGSNLGNRFNYLQQAIQFIQEYCGTVSQRSAFYQTAAWGITDQPDFYNQALVVETGLSPQNLMQTLLRIEAQMGRVRTAKMGPRVIDIDILMIGEEVINTPQLTVPHPFLAERRFALMPLAEIAPLARHPLLQKTVQELLIDCQDTLSVNKI